MSKVAFVLHGFNVSDGGVETIDNFIPYLIGAGYKVVQFDYNWTGVLHVRLCNDNLAKALASVAKAFKEDHVIAVGHSNGCAIINKACDYHAPFAELVYINPALNRNTRLADQVDAVHVWHSPSDKPVRIARWFIKHSWGDMGAVGYCGQDERYFNYNKENGFEGCTSRTHSDIFRPDKMRFFGPKIIEKVDKLFT